MKLVRRWIVRRKARAALRYLAKMDLAMIRRGYNRQQRKQFWHDFTVSPEARAMALSNLFRLTKVKRGKLRPVKREAS